MMTWVYLVVIAILSIEMAVASIVFAWAFWVALTQGDDVIARFGRKLLGRKR